MKGTDRFRAAGALLLGLATVTGAGGVAEPGLRHPINLDRPMIAGQRLLVRVRSREHEAVEEVVRGRTESGRVRTTELAFRAECTIAATDGRGWPTSADYKVEEFRLAGATGDRPVAPPGTVMHARREGVSTVFEIDGRPLDPEAAAAMRLLAFTVADTSLDRRLGTRQPRRVGDSWDVRITPMATALGRRLGFPVIADGLAGRATLVDAVEHDGVRSLVLYAEVSGDGVEPAADECSAGCVVTESTLTSTYHVIVPRDRHRLLPVVVSETVTVDAVLVSDGSGVGPGLEVRYRLERFDEVAWTVSGAE